jgi:hypothetical protein
MAAPRAAESEPTPALDAGLDDLASTTLARDGPTEIYPPRGRVLPAVGPSAGAASGQDVLASHQLRVLADLAPAVLSSLHTYLSTQSTRQGQERYPLAQPVHVQSRTAELAVSARLRDIGREELALLSPCQLPFGAVTLTLSRWASPNVVQVPGWVRDCVPGSDNQFEVEVRLGG